MQKYTRSRHLQKRETICIMATHKAWIRDGSSDLRSLLSYIFSATPVKVSRVASARRKEKTKSAQGARRRGPEDERGKKERGFLNEKYRVKLSLRLLLPNRPPSSSSSCYPPWVASTSSRIGFAASRGQDRVDFFPGGEQPRWNASCVSKNLKWLPRSKF